MALADFVERTVARVRETPVDLARLAPHSIPGWLYSGAPGVAFFLYEVARLRGDDALLPLARRWCAAGRAWASTATHAEWDGLARGFLMGEAGLSYVEALLAAQEGDAGRALAAVTRIDHVSERFDDLGHGFRATEIVSGMAGILSATRNLDARLPGGATHEATRQQLTRIRDRATSTLLAIYAQPLDPQANDYRGFAHGTAGELWALASVVGAGQAIVRARLAELAALRDSDDDGLVYWLPKKQNVVTEVLAFLGTWCNGMAGHAVLWCDVAGQTGDGASRELAGAAARSVATLVTENPGLCCGLAGHSVALQRYADLSGDAWFARRAYDRLSRAVAVATAADNPDWLGLWDGDLGVALVALSRLRRERAFPCLEPPRKARAAARSR